MLTAERGAAALTLTLAILHGCSRPSLKTYPVQGTVQIKDGDVALLTGSHIEFMNQSDPLVRPSGKITSGGSFAVQTLHEGTVLSGAPEGKYKARIILGDESDEGVPKRKGNPVHKRYLDFETSGLSFTVPSGDITILLSQK